MRGIKYHHPDDLRAMKGAEITVKRMPKELSDRVDGMAREVWDYSKRKITVDGNTVLDAADTMTSAFAAKIEEFLSDREHLDARFGGKRPKDREMASRAGFSLPKWNRITAGKLLDVERGNAFAVAIALKLNEEQTVKLLYSAGFALNYTHELDCAVMYFINREIYDINLINATLSQFCNIKNGLDNFTFLPR